jgi:hypothetical protein
VKGWQRPFENIVVLPEGRQFITQEDTGPCITTFKTRPRAPCLSESGRPRVRLDARSAGKFIQDLLAGEYSNPIGVFGFNPLEGWSHDVSADVAQELRRRCELQLQDVPASIADFVERHEGRSGRQLASRLR